MTTTAVPGLTGPAAQAAAQVAQTLAGHAPLGVAYSGGVDSATLLALAVRALGPANVVAVLGVSPSLATDERARAHETAAVIGARVVEIETHEGQSAAYRANGPDRCFHCKDELFTRIDDELVTGLGLAAVAYGENADDAQRPDRPGSRAATDHRVLRPMAEAGMTKAMVREVARAMALPVADKPAAPCLASRIPHFEEVTPEKLRQVDRAEGALRRLGFTDCRVRHHGDVARIELLPEELLAAVQRREDVDRAVRDAGFRFAALDLRGIQSGAFTLPLVSVRG
ncbi:ATP-dependent sacrificial sulfur transferase LarE [Georgenia satyanarayanai]|uniref:ATP-dependent sacrificial sulfur transferase LarE n=1 Tax=Georgenia satyanarayanai TaxID=860221 RepID=UPI0012653BBF|nr:ATP-dependent sacrificial sulfur transferase LarE [Georgenia satyanarayanai]